MGWAFWQPRLHLVGIFAAFVSLVWLLAGWQYAYPCGVCLAVGFFYGAHARDDRDLH